MDIPSSSGIARVAENACAAAWARRSHPPHVPLAASQNGLEQPGSSHATQREPDVGWGGIRNVRDERNPAAEVVTNTFTQRHVAD